MKTYARPPKLSPRLLLDPVHLFALGLGSGLSPRAPGTVGTLAAVPIIMFIAQWGAVTLAIATAFMCVSGVFICEQSAKKLKLHDHPAIVWDEFCGFAITISISMLAAPLQWYHWLVGFALFRFFDIVKPWPIREADHSLVGGLGIMLDDVIAGVFAGLLLCALEWAL